MFSSESGFLNGRRMDKMEKHFPRENISYFISQDKECKTSLHQHYHVVFICSNKLEFELFATLDTVVFNIHSIFSDVLLNKPCSGLDKFAESHPSSGKDIII